MPDVAETTPDKTSFDAGYYGRYDRNRLWRRRGDRPLLYRSMLRILKPWHGGRLLDVGCGEGQFLRRASRFFMVAGIDVSREGVARAREATGLSTVDVGTATELSSPDGSVDVVSLLDVVEHLPEPELALREAARVLRRGGALLLSTPNPASFGHRRKGRESFMHRDETHVSLKPIDEWRRLIARAGFSIRRDGTDTLWDAPYFGRRTARLERPLLLLVSQVMWAIRPMYPWRFGENYVCLAVKS